MKLTRAQMALPPAQRIALVALLAVTRPKEWPGFPRDSFYCLKFARMSYEIALGLRDRAFYDLVLGEDGNPTAHQLEGLLRRQRPAWVVADGQPIRPGDFLFWPYSEKKPNGTVVQWGHVGVAIEYTGQGNKQGKTIWVAQNTMMKKGRSFGVEALRLIPLADMGPPRTVIRPFR